MGTQENMVQKLELHVKRVFEKLVCVCGVLYLPFFFVVLGQHIFPSLGLLSYNECLVNVCGYQSCILIHPYHRELAQPTFQRQNYCFL